MLKYIRKDELYPFYILEDDTYYKNVPPVDVPDDLVLEYQEVVGKLYTLLEKIEQVKNK